MDEDRAVRSVPYPKSARGANDRPLSPSRHLGSLPAPVARKLARCRSRYRAAEPSLDYPTPVSAPSELERNHPTDAKEHPCAWNGFPKTKVLVEQLHRRRVHLSDKQIPTDTPLPAGKHRELSQTARSGDVGEAGIAPSSGDAVESLLALSLDTPGLDGGSEEAARPSRGSNRELLPSHERDSRLTSTSRAATIFGSFLSISKAGKITLCPAGFLHCSGSYFTERKVTAARRRPRGCGRSR